jgi:hypothetical protein
MFSTVLNGVKLQHANGMLRLDSIQAVFLPTPNDSNYYPYNPNDGGKLWTILRTADGTELFRLDWYADPLKLPFWLLDSYNTSDLATGETDNSEWLDMARPGDYVLDFYLEGELFYTYPFTISRLASPDPYAGGDYYFLEGDWSDWGYFYYPDANPEQSIQFKVWLNNHAAEEYGEVKPRMEVRRGGTLVATGRPNMTYTLKPEWVRYELDLIFPMEGTSGGAYFKAKDLLATDGDYTLSLYLSDELYGTWNFSVRGGKFATTGRADRSVANPLVYVDGGRDAFWFRKN